MDFRSVGELTSAPGTLVIGTWDPVLPEHVALWTRLSDREARLVVVTLRPHPQTVLRGAAAWPSVDSPSFVIRAQLSSGAECVVCELTTASISGTADEFLDAATDVTDIAKIVLGARQSVGPASSGGRSIEAACADRDIVCERLPPLGVGPQSSLVRRQLSDGDLSRAVKTLNRSPQRAHRPGSGTFFADWPDGDYRCELPNGQSQLLAADHSSEESVMTPTSGIVFVRPIEYRERSGESHRD